jgi:hypothetical protein
VFVIFVEAVVVIVLGFVIIVVVAVVIVNFKQYLFVIFHLQDKVYKIHFTD